MALPRFDKMSADQLMEFWSKTNRSGRKFAAELFPSKPKGYVTAMRQLGNYASNLATARSSVRRRDRQAAEIYYSIADKIWDDLPSWAKPVRKGPHYRGPGALPKPRTDSAGIAREWIRGLDRDHAQYADAEMFGREFNDHDRRLRIQRQLLNSGLVTAANGGMIENAIDKIYKTGSAGDYTRWLIKAGVYWPKREKRGRQKSQRRTPSAAKKPTGAAALRRHMKRDA